MRRHGRGAGPAGVHHASSHVRAGARAVERSSARVVVLTAAPPTRVCQLQVEAEEVDDLAMRYNVPSVPYFLLFKVLL